MEIAGRIVSLMNEKKLSRYKLAKLTGIPYTTLIKILDGTTKNPQIETLSAIADFLGVSVDFLSGQSVGAIIETELRMSGMTVDRLAERAHVRKEFILNIDRIDPMSGDYEAVERIARVLNVKPTTMRSALARQEPPAYDGPSDSRSLNEIFADEDFSETLPEKFDRTSDTENLRDEVKTLEKADNALKHEGLSVEEIAALDVLNAPQVGIFFKDFLDAPEERREEMIRIWHVIREAEKGRKPGDKQGDRRYDDE